MYKHLDLLEQLTEAARTNDKPWEEFQCTEMNGLSLTVKDTESMNDLFGWIEDFDFKWRRKPKFIKTLDDICLKAARDWVESIDLTTEQNRKVNDLHLLIRNAIKEASLLPIKNEPKPSTDTIVIKQRKRIKDLESTLELLMELEPNPTVTINGVELKDDRYTLDDLPENEQRVYIEAPSAKDFHYNYIWGFDSFDNAMLIEREIAHKTPEGAAAFTKASIKRG